MIYRAVVYITYQCPYYCPYCYSYNEENPIDYRKTMPKSIDPKYWIEFFKSFPDGSIIDFTGGEPLAYYGLEEILDEFPKLMFAFTSNLSFPLDKILRTFNRDNIFSVTCSWHPTQTTPEKFIEKITALKEIGKSVGVNYVTYKGLYKGEKVNQLDNIPETIKMFSDIGISCHIDPYVGDKMVYTTEQENFVRGYTQNRQIGETIKVKSMKPCIAGYRYFSCEANGNVWRCNHFSFAQEKTGYLGNIEEGTFKKLSEPADCPLEYCSGGCDIDAIKNLSTN